MDCKLTDEELKPLLDKYIEDNRPKAFDILIESILTAQIAKLQSLGWKPPEEIERLTNVARAAGKADGFKDCQNYYASLVPEKVREELLVMEEFECTNCTLDKCLASMKATWLCPMEVDQILSLLGGWFEERCSNCTFKKVSLGRTGD